MRWMRRMMILAVPTALACSAETPSTPVTEAAMLHEGDAHGTVTLAPGNHFDIVRDEPFQQVGLAFDSRTAELEFRADGGPWRNADVTWSEGKYHAGRIVLDGPARRLELRAPGEGWSFSQVTFLDEVRIAPVLTRDLPMAKRERSPVNALAPADLVISRAEWGARDPEKVCGSAHDPYRMAIHHTAIPADDGGDAAARMRQIQAGHIDGNNWCDIGYHFVVSQAGDIYQGRSSEERTGAHTGGNNTGNVGVCLIGNFEEQNVNDAQFSAAADIVGWIGRTYDIPFDRQSIKGHQEHEGNSTACPGTNLLNRLDELIDEAAGRSEEGNEAGFEVRWLGDIEDFYASGSSVGKPDLLEGESAQFEIAFANTSSLTLRNVALDYWFETPHVRATNYVIETDAPGFDGMSWTLNDADANPENPEKNEMGQTGTLGLYAMAAGETKRVVVDITADQYSLGLVDHPDVRAWVRHIDGLYADQVEFDTEPDTNAFVGLLQSVAELDVLSTKEWQFDAGEESQVEGWQGCAGVTPRVDVEAGALGATFGPVDCIDSPEWTKVSAEDFDQLVVRMDVPASDFAVVYWARDGESLSESKAFMFEVSPDQSTYVVPVGTHDEWAGEIVDLRLMPLVEAAGQVSVDAIFFQNSDGTVGSVREEYVPAPPTPDMGEPPAPDAEPGFVPEQRPSEEFADDEFRVKEGCSTANSPAQSGLLVLVFFAVIRIRRHVTCRRWRYLPVRHDLGE